MLRNVTLRGDREAEKAEPTDQQDQQAEQPEDPSDVREPGQPLEQLAVGNGQSPRPTFEVNGIVGHRNSMIAWQGFFSRLLWANDMCQMGYGYVIEYR